MAQSMPHAWPERRGQPSPADLRRRRWITRAAVGACLLVATFAAVRSHAGRLATTDRATFHQQRFPFLAAEQGDLLRLATPAGEVRVRLLGIDAHGRDGAREAAQTHAAGREVLLFLEEVPTRDAEGVLLAYAFLEPGASLNERLVAEGEAFADRRWEYLWAQAFAAAEANARRRGIGMWATLMDEEMPAWRRRWLAEIARKPWEPEEDAGPPWDE